MLRYVAPTAATIIAIGCGGRIGASDSSVDSVGGTAGARPDSGSSQADAGPGADSWDALQEFLPDSHPDELPDGGSDAPACDNLPKVGLTACCAGKPCLGQCWPTEDECNCGSVQGGCPSGTVCCGMGVCKADSYCQW